MLRKTVRRRRIFLRQALLLQMPSNRGINNGGPLLPAPRWGDPSPQLHISTSMYNNIVPAMIKLIEEYIVNNHYDSVENFLTFYDSFVSKNAAGFFPVVAHFKEYAAAKTFTSKTCVGQANELQKALNTLNSHRLGITNAFFIASCEDQVEDVDTYAVPEGPHEIDTSLKSHVVLAAHINIDGRNGILLTDPGFHLAKLVTVMEDEMPPHTGWLLQSTDAACTKYYNYFFHPTNRNYVVLRIKKQYSDEDTDHICHHIIYVARPYVNADDVTERRNLVFVLKGLLARDAMGNVRAGVHFTIRPDSRSFTVMRQIDKVVVSTKHSLSHLKKTSRGYDALTVLLTRVNAEMGFSEGKLTTIMSCARRALKDMAFMTRINQIDSDIKQYYKKQHADPSRD